MADLNNYRCCIHVGLPKTATTTLQFGLFSNLSQINYLGKPYYDENAGYEKSKAVADLVNNICQQDTLDYDTNWARQLFKKGIDSRIDQQKILFLSEEAFTNASAVDRGLIAKRLRDLFGPCKILITIRNQLNCLTSLYLWHYTRRSINGSFDKWISRCLKKSVYIQAISNWPLRQYRYAEVLKLFGKLFDSENICVLLFEDLLSNLNRFCSEMATFLEIDDDEVLRLLKNQHFNPSLSSVGVAHQRLIKGCRLIFQRLAGDLAPEVSEGLESKGLNRIITRYLSRLSAARVSMSPKTINLLKDYYREDNKKLIDAFDLPIDQYDYPI